MKYCRPELGSSADVARNKERSVGAATLTRVTNFVYNTLASNTVIKISIDIFFPPRWPSYVLCTRSLLDVFNTIT